MADNANQLCIFPGPVLGLESSLRKTDGVSPLVDLNTVVGLLGAWRWTGGTYPAQYTSMRQNIQ